MTAQTLAQVAKMQQSNTYVPPVDDETVGWNLFFHGHAVTDCRNRAQRTAYYAAWERGAQIVAEDRSTGDIYGGAVENDYCDIRRGN